MRLQLYSWNGHLLNDNTNFNAWYDIGQRPNLSGGGNYVKRAQNFPVLATNILPEHKFSFHVLCNGNLASQYTTLGGWFNVLDFQQHQLVAIDLDNANKQWYLQGLVERVVLEQTSVVGITITLYDPIWRTVTQNTDPWSITASGQTHAITINSTISAKPIFTITPTASRTGGYGYKRWYSLYNQSTNPYGFAVSSRDITEGGLDTASLVLAGKMQSSCNDLRVVMDGNEIDVFITSPNTNHTKVWCNIPLSPGQNATLLTTISNVGGVTQIALTKVSASKNVLLAIANAANKVVLIDSEAFAYTGVDTVNYLLTGVTRSIKGTTAASHTGGTAIVQWIEHDVWMEYGNASVGAPDINSNNQPLLDMTNSTNSTLIWSNYFDTTASRPFAWNGQVQKTVGNSDYIYTGDGSAGSGAPAYANPASEMGMSMLNYLSGNTYKPETATIAWSFYHPGGMTTVTVSGKKNTNSTSVWPVTCIGLQKLQPGSTTNWLTVFNEAKPASANTWTVLTNNASAKALGATYNNIRLAMIGSVSLSNAIAESDVQFDTVSVALDTSKTAIGNLGAEQLAYYFSFTLKNNTSGESLIFTFPGTLNQALTIDCLNRLVTLADGTNLIGGLQFSSIRQDWLNLTPDPGTGQVTLEFDDAGISNTTLVTAWNDRAF